MNKGRKNRPLTIPLSIPVLGGQELHYLQQAIVSNWVSSEGPFVTDFERALERYLGGGHAVATVNGTAALHVALRVAGVGPGSLVLLPGLTFAATANAVIYCGARPVFLDVDPDTWTIDPKEVGRFLTEECKRDNKQFVHRASGDRPRAIVPVHLLGHPSDMTPLFHWARSYQLSIIEDSCESLGATYKGVPTGRLGDMACLSFNGNKTVTCGGGGMVICRDNEVARRIRHLTTQAKAHPTEYIHDAVGFNYRLTNLQAAVGLAQMEQLPKFLERKQVLATRYEEGFRDLKELLPAPRAGWAKPSYWLYTLRWRGARPGAVRRLVTFLARQGIQARCLWRPLPDLPIYPEAIAHPIPVCERLYQECVSLPSTPNLIANDQDRVIEAVSRFVIRERKTSR